MKSNPKYLEKMEGLCDALIHQQFIDATENYVKHLEDMVLECSSILHYTVHRDSVAFGNTLHFQNRIRDLIIHLKDTRNYLNATNIPKMAADIQEEPPNHHRRAKR